MDGFGMKIIFQEMNQDPFTQNQILDGSEFDPMDPTKIRRSEWRSFRRNAVWSLRRETRQLSGLWSRDRDRDRIQRKLEPGTGSGVTKIVRDNPGFDPVFMKI